MLCTLADITTRLVLGSEFDAMLTRMIASFTAVADTVTGRTLLMPAADVTEYHAGGCELIQLLSYPIVSITTLKELVGDFDFSGADALVADTDYRVISPGARNRGVIARLYIAWPDGFDTVQVIYKGGYCAAGVTPSTGQYALPDDLREAAIEQVIFWFKRREDSNLSSTGVTPGTVNTYSPMDLLPTVKAILDKYLRVSI